MTEIPHFALPFRFEPQAAVTEQDSLEEITDCVLAVLLCPLGYRVELPDFGVPDPAFSSPVVDVDELRTRIEAWEERAAVVIGQEPDAVDVLVAHVKTLVQVRTEA